MGDGPRATSKVQQLGRSTTSLLLPRKTDVVFVVAQLFRELGDGLAPGSVVVDVAL